MSVAYHTSAAAVAASNEADKVVNALLGNEMPLQFDANLVNAQELIAVQPPMLPLQKSVDSATTDDEDQSSVLSSTDESESNHHQQKVTVDPREDAAVAMVKSSLSEMKLDVVPPLPTEQEMIGSKRAPADSSDEYYMFYDPPTVEPHCPLDDSDAYPTKMSVLRSMVDGPKVTIDTMQLERMNVELADLMVDGKMLIKFLMNGYGSKYTQRMMESPRTTRAEVVEFVSCLTPYALRVGRNVFAHYVLLSAFDILAKRPCKETESLMIGVLRENVIGMATNQYGCRVLQRTMKYDGLMNVKRVILHEVSKDERTIERMITDEFGNYVWQKIAENSEAGELNYLASNIAAHCVLYSCNVNGCRVVKKVISHCSHRQTDPVYVAILDNIHKLCTDEFGNYVVKHAIQFCDNPRWLKKVAHFLSRECSTLVRQRYSANVIEKVIPMLTPKMRERIFESILRVNVPQRRRRGFRGTERTVSLVSEMVRCEFGNFVVQAMLKGSTDRQFRRICDAIKRDIKYAELMDLKWGKFVFERMQ